MALVLADRVQETTTVAGTGTATLLGAVSGYQSFAVVGDGNTTYYTIAAQSGTEWEVGIGTYASSGTTLARTTVLSSSNSGSLVSFSAGTKNVFVTYPSSVAASVGAAYARTSFTATAGQTAFTVTYSVNYLQVYVNGVLLAPSDYTASSGTGFTLAVGANAGDIVDALVITTSVVNTGVTTGKSIAMAMIFGY
jgi:outer membrane protein assembly factor BamB